jgi:hypothetical protein
MTATASGSIDQCSVRASRYRSFPEAVPVGRESGSTSAAFAVGATPQERACGKAHPQDRFPVAVLVAQFGQCPEQVRGGDGAVGGQPVQRRGVQRDLRLRVQFDPSVRAGSVMDTAEELEQSPWRATVRGGHADQVGAAAFAVDRSDVDR